MSKFGFDKVKTNLAKANKEIPLILANEAKNAFLKNFDNQGYNGATWQVPKRRIDGTPEYKYPKTKGLGRRTANTLVGKGKLRRDVANSVDAGYPVADGYVGVVKNEYGQYHNDGAEHLPQRRFVGFPDSLVTKLKDKAQNVWNKIWQT